MTTFVLQFQRIEVFDTYMGTTPNRSIRIPDALWKKVKAKAKSEHKTVTQVIIALLFKWVNE